MGMLQMAVSRQREFDNQDRNAKAGVKQSGVKQQEQEKPAWHNYALNQREAAKDQVESKGKAGDLQRDHEERKVAHEQEKHFHQAHGRYQKSGEELDKFTYDRDNDPKVIKDRQVDAYREDKGRYPRNDSDLSRWNDQQAKKSQGQGQAASAVDMGVGQQEQGEEKAQGTAQSRFGKNLGQIQGQAQTQEQTPEQAPQAAQSQEQPRAERGFGSKLEAQRQGQTQPQEQALRQGPPSLEEGVKAAREDAQNRTAQLNQEQGQGKVRSLGRA